MEMELGVKFTRAADEFSSDFQFRAGPLFLSTETDAMFLLTAHLKGYKRENIKIDINEDGSLIGISGERQVQETVIAGWKVYKKDAEIKGFKKVFKIPNGVILDKIKAKYNEDESTLTITMAKKVKGIRGTAIEEVKEKQDLIKEGSGKLQIADEKLMPKEEKPVSEHSCTEGVRQIAELKDGEKVDEIEERTEGKHDRDIDGVVSSSNNGVADVCEEERLKEEKEDGNGEVENQEKRFKMCIPIVAGSALLLSFVVFVIQIVRSKSQNSRRRD